MDLQSILGYSRNSPFRGNPYLDINTPTGLIDMSNTNIDLVGIDNLGNKKKMKAGRKNPYKFDGNLVREIPFGYHIMPDGSIINDSKMQQGGVISTYKTRKEINDANDFLHNFLQRKNAPNANNMVVARDIGDPRVQFEYTSNSVPNTVSKANTLPKGVSVDEVFLNAQGQYGYIDPIYNNWVPVDANSIYSLYGKKPIAPATNAIAKAFRYGGKMQKGGFSYKDLYDYLFKDDYEEDYDNKNTAPSEAELPQVQQQQQQEPDDYEMALQMAMQQDDLNISGRNPYGASISESLPQRVPGVNPYSGSPENINSSANANNPSKYAFEFFKNKGLPAHVAAGIVGNLIQESGNFRPDVVSDKIKGDQGTSHGIAQWHKDRWPQLQKWATSQGKNPLNLDTQLEYVYTEANQRGDLQKTLSAQTPEEAANIFAKYYERPAVIDKNRARNARNLYQQ